MIMAATARSIRLPGAGAPTTSRIHACFCLTPPLWTLTRPAFLLFAVSLLVYGFVQVCRIFFNATSSSTQFPYRHRRACRSTDFCILPVPHRSQERDPPLLCSLDLWQYDSSQPWQDTAMDDSALEVRSIFLAATAPGAFWGAHGSYDASLLPRSELYGRRRAGSLSIRRCDGDGPPAGEARLASDDRGGGQGASGAGPGCATGATQLAKGDDPVVPRRAKASA